MGQFDDYINSIIKGLRITEEKKAEMAEEFLDHLQMLKMEYLAKGMSESDATKQAMITFGEEKRLKRELSKSLSSYKSLHNIIGGVIILLIAFIIGRYVPVPGYDLEYSHSPIYSPIYGVLYTVMPNNILFIALGYYLPIFLKRMEKIQNILLASIVTGVVYRLFIHLLFSTSWNSLEITTKLIMLASPLVIISNIIESMLGFTLLQLFHRMPNICKKSVIKHFD